MTLDEKNFDILNMFDTSISTTSNRSISKNYELSLDTCDIDTYILSLELFYKSLIFTELLKAQC